MFVNLYIHITYFINLHKILSLTGTLLFTALHYGILKIIMTAAILYYSRTILYILDYLKAR